MLCPNCGRNVNRGDRVCGHCGTRLPYEKMSDLEAAPPLSFLKGEQRGSGTEALQNAVNSQTQRIRELASEVAFLRTWEARSYGKTKRVLCMSIVSLVLCLLLVVISFVHADKLSSKLSSVEQKTNELSDNVLKKTNELSDNVLNLSNQIEDEKPKREEIERELLDALKENLTLHAQRSPEPMPEPTPESTPKPTPTPTPKLTPESTPGQDGETLNGEADVDPLTEE